MDKRKEQAMLEGQAKVDWRDYFEDQRQQEYEAIERGDELLAVMVGDAPHPSTYTSEDCTEWEGDVDYAALPDSQWWDVQKMEAAS